MFSRVKVGRELLKVGTCDNWIFHCKFISVKEWEFIGKPNVAKSLLRVLIFWSGQLSHWLCGRCKYLHFIKWLLLISFLSIQRLGFGFDPKVCLPPRSYRLHTFAIKLPWHEICPVPSEWWWAKSRRKRANSAIPYECISHHSNWLNDALCKNNRTPTRSIFFPPEFQVCPKAENGHLQFQALHQRALIAKMAKKKKQFPSNRPTSNNEKPPPPAQGSGSSEMSSIDKCKKPHDTVVTLDKNGKSVAETRLSVGAQANGAALSAKKGNGALAIQVGQEEPTRKWSAVKKSVYKTI